jgi:hypothetical protein
LYVTRDRTQVGLAAGVFTIVANEMSALGYWTFLGSYVNNEEGPLLNLVNNKRQKSLFRFSRLFWALFLSFLPFCAKKEAGLPDGIFSNPKSQFG